MLTEALRSASQQVRRAALEILANLNQAPAEVIETLKVALEDEDQQVRVMAVNALGHWREHSTEVIEILRSTLSENDQQVRLAAVETLGQLDKAPAEAIELAKVALEDEDQQVRVTVAYAIGDLGDASSAAIDTLSSALGNGHDVVVSDAALYALNKLGETSPEAVRVLEQALESESQRVRFSVADSLLELGKDPSELIQVLLEAVREHPSFIKRRDFAHLLSQSNVCIEDVISTLMMGFTDEDNDVRTACAEALAGLGRIHSEVTEEITSRLIEALTDPKFDPVDRYAGRSGHDYAFDGLWMLIIGEQAEVAV